MFTAMASIFYSRVHALTQFFSDIIAIGAEQCRVEKTFPSQSPDPSPDCLGKERGSMAGTSPIE